MLVSALLSPSSSGHHDRWCIWIRRDVTLLPALLSLLRDFLCFFYRKMQREKRNFLYITQFPEFQDGSGAQKVPCPILQEFQYLLWRFS